MKTKKMLALTLGATMTMGMAMPVMAADPTVTAPIYSFETIDVVVPTTYKVAFNPEGLTVKTDATNTSTDQILSKNYGILNKSNKDMVCRVALKITDKNTGDNKVEFVDSADEVTNAKDGEYKIHLTAVPADDTEVKVGTTPASADKDTAAASLDDVTMTKAADTNAVTLKGGDNLVAFKLLKAEYQAKAGSEVTLGTTSANDVASNYEIKALAGTGKGITAFTFSGSMNAKADWTQLQSGIEITSVYTPEIAPSDATVITGTGAMIKAEAAPSIATTTYPMTADTAIEIPVDLGAGDLAAEKVSHVMDPTGAFDYLSDAQYATYDADNKKVTLTAAMVNACISGNVPSIKIVFNDSASTEISVTLTK